MPACSTFIPHQISLDTFKYIFKFITSVTKLYEMENVQSLTTKDALILFMRIYINR